MLWDLAPWSVKSQALLKGLGLFASPPLQLSLCTRHKQLLLLSCTGNRGGAKEVAKSVSCERETVASVPEVQNPVVMKRSEIRRGSALQRVL